MGGWIPHLPHLPKKAGSYGWTRLLANYYHGAARCGQTWSWGPWVKGGGIAPPPPRIGAEGVETEEHRGLVQPIQELRHRVGAGLGRTGCLGLREMMGDGARGQQPRSLRGCFIGETHIGLIVTTYFICCFKNWGTDPSCIANVCWSDDVCM